LYRLSGGATTDLKLSASSAANASGLPVRGDLLDLTTEQFPVEGAERDRGLPGMLAWFKSG